MVLDPRTRDSRGFGFVDYEDPRVSYLPVAEGHLRFLRHWSSPFLCLLRKNLPLHISKEEF